MRWLSRVNWLRYGVAVLTLACLLSGLVFYRQHRVWDLQECGIHLGRASQTSDACTQSLRSLRIEAACAAAAAGLLGDLEPLPAQCCAAIGAYFQAHCHCQDAVSDHGAQQLKRLHKICFGPGVRHASASSVGPATTRYTQGPSHQAGHALSSGSNGAVSVESVAAADGVLSPNQTFGAAAASNSTDSTGRAGASLRPRASTDAANPMAYPSPVPASGAAFDAHLQSGDAYSAVQESPVTPAQGAAGAGAAAGVLAWQGVGKRNTGAAEQPPVRLFVGVLTLSGHAEHRAAIRSTWGSHPALHRVVFFCAQPGSPAALGALRGEAAVWGDLAVVPGVAEHYDNITHQTLEALRFAAADPTVTHLLKADDDSYVHVSRLMRLLSRAPRHRIFMGHLELGASAPHRDPSHPWFVSREDWPVDAYPPWAHGVGYVLSVDLVREIAAGGWAGAAGSDNGRLFKLEDIAAASWVAAVAADRNWTLHYLRSPRFNYMGCRRGDVVSHYTRPDQARCMFAKPDQACCP